MAREQGQQRVEAGERERTQESQCGALKGASGKRHLGGTDFL